MEVIKTKNLYWSILLGVIFTFLFNNPVFAQHRIMPLGNSITYGDGSSADGGYRDDLATLLTNEGVSFTFVGTLNDGAGNHEGHSGSKSYEINGQLNSYLAATNPDIILLHIGTNDISGGQSNWAIIREIRSIVDKIYIYNSSCKILLCSLIPRMDSKDEQTTALNVEIQSLVASKKSIGFYIFYVGQNEIFKSNPHWESDYMFDYLHPNDTGYHIMAKKYHSAIVNALRSLDPMIVVDNFNRSQLGPNWAADPEYQIVNNELSNTSTTGGWDFLAVYKVKTNPYQVSFKWGMDADAAGINEGGLALMLDSPSADANGYLVWRHTSNNKLDIWTIEGGSARHPIGQADGQLPAPSAGDEFTVAMSTNESGHHFNCYINGEFDGKVTDPNKLQGNGSTRYSGVMLNGNLNNNIDDFAMDSVTARDKIPPAKVDDLAVASVAETSVQLIWTAPGNDGDQGTASSYDLRYSTTPIDEGNFDSATKVTGTPAPSIAGTPESYTVTDLRPNTTYHFALKTLDEVYNTSLLSNSTSAITHSDGVVDNFNRGPLGPNWAADAEYQIVNEELANTSAVSNWGLAVYKIQQNTVQASFKWGANADAAGINAGGLALMMDAASPNASGYLVWRHTSYNALDIYTIVNGVPVGQSLGQTAGQLSAPTSGDEFAVILSTDDAEHHFDCYINGQFDGRVTDPNKLQGNGSTLYSGVMLKGNLNNNIDDFTIRDTISIDTTRPAVVKLAVGNVTETSIQLNWTAPGDDEHQGTALRYDLRYSTSQITEANFLDATQVAGMPAPSPAGTQESFVVKGLQLGTTYYFALKTIDEANNTSLLSNVVSAIPLPDETPPDAVTLIRGRVVSTSVQLSWIAPGDDGDQGTASSYDLRYSTSIINDFNFANATPVAGMPTPSAAGTPESFIVSDLQPGTDYYFALKTIDDEGNTSDLSNVVTAITLPAVTIVDDFNRSVLGEDWTADPEYQIVYNELANTSTDPFWDFLAVYDARRNPFEVSFKWGTGADAAGIDEGGFALMLDAPSADANGYLVWRRTTAQRLYLYTIEGGRPGSGEVTNTSAALPAPQAGDIFKVEMCSDTSGHHFDCFINGQFDGTISDVNKLQGNSSPLYAGVMLKGGINNNIDNFTLTTLLENPSNLAITDGNYQGDGVGGQPLNKPFVVKVYDENLNPHADIPVTFTVKQGCGTLDGNVDTVKTIDTDVNGKAQVTLTVGKIGVTHKVEVSSPGLASVTFTATADSGVATNMIALGDDQIDTVGTTLEQPFVVKVTDQQSAPVSDIPVDFVIIEGSGSPLPSLSQNNPPTAANGEASTVLTLGTQAGIHKVKASVPSSDLQFIFTATAIAGDATDLVYESGRDQTGKGGVPLSDPFVVKVTDQYGNDKSGIPVTFSVTAGGGSLSDTLAATDTTGLAAAFLTLGTESDTNKVAASSPGLQGSIEFIAIATSGVADSIIYFDGNYQTGTVKTTLPNPFKVKVIDKLVQGIQNHKVHFKVTLGGGTLDGASVTEKEVFTDSNGIAQVTLTLGADLAINSGVNIVEASATARDELLPDSPIIFTATALVPNLEEVSGDNQNGSAGMPLEQPFVVKVTDEQGNPFPGQKVTFSVTQGGGSIDGNHSKDDTTGEDGKASVILTLGPIDGQTNEVVVSAHHDGVPLDGPAIVFRATAGEVSDLIRIGGNNQLGTAGQPLSDSFKVRVLNSFNMPVSNHPVTFSVTQGGGTFGGSSDITVQTDSEGFAQAILTLGSTPGDTNKTIARSFRNGFDLNGSPKEFTAVAAGIKEIKDFSGNNQVDTVATPLPLPFEVKIIDDLGKTPKGFPVNFVVTAGGGNFNGDSTFTAQTNEVGIAAATLTLGNIPGEENNIVEARASYKGESLEPVTFLASAVPGAPTKLVYVAGDSQKQVRGSRLAKPLKVKITDHVDNALNEHPVTFTVIDGDGRLGDNGDTTVTKLTDGAGIAEVSWTLGNVLGDTNNVVEAAAFFDGAPLEDSPVVFKASALPYIAAVITPVSDTLQEGVAGKPLNQPLIVNVTDDSGRKVAKHPVVFKVITGGGTLDGDIDTVKTVNTVENGDAEVTLTLGGKAGVDNIVHAISVNGPETLIGAPVKFTVTSKAGPVDAGVSTIVCAPESLLVGSESQAIITVTLTDTFRNPISGKEVLLTSSDSAFLQQPLELTNADGQAFGSITSTKAGVKIISARDVTDSLDLTSTKRVVFLHLEPSDLRYVLGNDQTANIGTALLLPLTVQVIDSFENGIQNHQVYFKAISGEGSIIEAQPMYTDSRGEASATFILGQSVGTQNFAEARAESLNGSPVVFMANAKEGQAANISLFSGTPQSGRAGYPLPEPFVVKVTDSNGLPVWDYAVTFEVDVGNGNFYGQSSIIVRTDYLGLASTQFALDRVAGNNSVKAKASGLNGSPVTFSAQGQVEAARLHYVQGDSQKVAVKLQLPLPLKVRVTDFYSNGISDYQVIYNIIQGDGQFMENQLRHTDSNGYARINLQLGQTAGEVVIETEADELINSPVRFTLTAISWVPASMALYSGDDQHGTVGRQLPFPLKVIVKDIYNNPVAGVDVEWGIVDGSGSLVDGQFTTSAQNGVARNWFMLGENIGLNTAYAIITGLQGPPIVFSAQGVENKFPLFGAVGDQVVNEGNSLEFSLSASDDDGDAVTYGVRDLPRGADFDSTGSQQFSWTPDFTQAGDYEVIFLVYDDKGGVGTEYVNIHVNNINRKPQIENPIPQEVNLTVYQSEQDTIHFQITASDSDSEPLNYYWTQTAYGESFVVSTRDFYDFAAVDFLSGQHLITANVSDGIDTDSFEWSCNIRTLVELVSFTAEVVKYKGVKLEWQTSQEIHNAGYNILRSLSKDGVYHLINNALIPNNREMRYQYIDSDVEAGRSYYYKLEDVDKNGTKMQHEPISISVSAPKEYELMQNYPNPFNSTTKIKYQLPKPCQVWLKIYNILGQEVRILIEDYKAPGYHTSVWDGRDSNGHVVTSGIYFYHIQAERFVQTKRMILLK